MANEKVSLKEMFQEYAKQEMEFIKNSDPEKVYHRVLPNFKDKNKGSIELCCLCKTYRSTRNTQLIPYIVNTVPVPFTQYKTIGISSFSVKSLISNSMNTLVTAPII